MDRTWSRVREEVERGGRAFVVCARIDADDEADEDDGPTSSPTSRRPSARRRPPRSAHPKKPLRAVLEVAETLRTDPRLGGAAVGLLHGRMTSEEKDRAIADFASGRTPVLVSTTVIEVGVDVPAATVMVILDAHVFGLSQLHQLRGRVGPGERPGPVPARRGRPRGHRRRPAAGCARGDDRRVRARARRPRAAQGGRRPRLGAVRAARHAAVPAHRQRRRGHRPGARRRPRAGRGRPGADRVAGAARRDRPAAGRRARGVPRPELSAWLAERRPRIP